MKIEFPQSHKAGSYEGGKIVDCFADSIEGRVICNSRTIGEPIAFPDVMSGLFKWCWSLTVPKFGETGSD